MNLAVRILLDNEQCEQWNKQQINREQKMDADDSQK